MRVLLNRKPYISFETLSWREKIIAWKKFDMGNQMAIVLFTMVFIRWKIR